MSLLPNLSVNSHRHRRALGGAGRPVTFVRKGAPQLP